MSIDATTTGSSDDSLFNRDFGLLLFGSLFQGTSFFVLMPVLPLFVVGPLGEDKSAVGLVVGAFSFTAVLVRPLAGFFLDRYGRRTWQLGSGAVFSACLFLYLLADGLNSLLFIRLLHGLSWGMVGVASATVAADLIPARKRGTGMGIFGLAMPLALTVGPMLGAALLGGNRFSLIFLSSASVSVMAWFGFFALKHPQVKNIRARLQWNRVFEPRASRLFTLMLLLCVGYGGVVAFGPLYAPQVGLDSAAGLFTALGMGVILTRLFGGQLYDRFGPSPPTIIGLLLAIVGFAAMGFSPTPLGLLGGAGSLGLGFGVLMPSVQAMAIDLVPSDRRGAANATLFSAYDVGITLGSIGFGQMAEHLSMDWIFRISTALALVALVFLVMSVLPYFQRQIASTQEERT